MRIVTYIGLVARRVWARKLMLVGSFLGATLVTALLVILPLYEASVQAIDLLFTFRQAPASSVDLSAVHTQNQFKYEDAVETRERLEETAAPLSAWYPEIRERIVAQEFRVIPSDFPDWFAIVDEWRAAVAAGTLDEWLQTPNGEYGSPPYPVVPREPIETRLFTSPGLETLLHFVAGELVDDPEPRSAREPIMPVVFGEELARRSGVEVGDRIIIRGFISSPGEFEAVLVTGIARPADPTDVIWDQAMAATGGAHFLSSGADNLIYLTEATLAGWSGTPDDSGEWNGAFSAFDPSTDPWERRARGLRASSNQNFFMPLDRETVNLENVEALTASIRAFSSNLARDGIRSLSALPGIVEQFDVRVVVFGAPIVAMLALVVAGALYFLIYMASLAVERESNELALLRMRGASPWQTTGLHLIQSAMIALGSVLLAPFVARLMVASTGLIPPMSTLTGGEALAVELSRSILPFLFVGGMLTFVSMGLAILPVARRSVLELRALATRPAQKSVWQRYHLDLFLVVLSALLLWQLRQRGIVDTGQEELGLDPFSVAAPALFLLSGALLLLRVLPWILRGIGWVMTRVRGMTTALPGWHLGRNPIPYGRLALLVWLTTGFGAFALTYAATLEKSYDDRATYATGSDVRLVGEGVAFLEAPEGAVISPVLRTTGAPRLAQRGSELLAIDPESFAQVTAWRPDFGAPTASQAIGPEVLGPPIEWGITLPSGATQLRVDGVLVPESMAVRANLGPKDGVRFMARLVDDAGQYRIHTADAAFGDGSWRTALVDLSGA
ncbi:MAG TPA: FtsX-like permease family protein, partial [Acidimicrobiia bacterium]|nr:FtsX-like permease family protein [Acidimicrobiia bacterium]